MSRDVKDVGIQNTSSIIESKWKYNMANTIFDLHVALFL